MKRIKILFICISSTLAFACKENKVPISQNKGISVTANSTGLNLIWEGQSRISGTKPLFQGIRPEMDSIVSNNTGTRNKFNFKYQNTEVPVSVGYLPYQDRDALVLTLTTNGTQSIHGEDYVGLFFDDFPNYMDGIGSYLFGDWESWTKPVKVDDFKSSLPEKIQFFLFRYADGAYGAIMPLAGNGYVASLGSQENKFGARSVSYKDNFPADNVPMMAIAFGRDPYQTVKNLYEAGMEAMDKKEGLRKYKSYPEVFESIGWCSWNAFGVEVTEKNLMDAMATFYNNNFPVPFMLIDNGWLSVNGEEQLTDYVFDKKKFPNGFKKSILKLKNTYGLKDIGVWHTMNGFWSGVSKRDFDPPYQKLLMPYYDKEDVHADTLSGKTYFSPNALSDKGQQFYEQWYSYLKDQGISFVKVDQQAVIKRVAKGQLDSGEVAPFLEIAENMEQNLQNAIENNFNGSVINCQNMALEAVYNFGSSAIARSSDDFFPKVTAYYSLEEEKGNAAAHILMNVHNANWLSNLVWPDYDMFQSHHKDGEYHAISRAISGGPIYLTDEPGKQNFKILNKLVYSQGKILRPEQPGRPTEDCLFQINEPKPFKAFTKIGETGIIGAWNTVDKDLVTGTISPSDVHSIKGNKFAVYEHFSQKLKTLERNESMPVQLGRMGYALYNIVPIENDIALIGLVDKYLSQKTIISQSIEQGTIKVNLRASGKFAGLLPKEPVSIWVNDNELASDTWSYQGGLFVVSIPKVNFEAQPIELTIKLKD
ncbi:Raffinose synthase or seed imbibition protein Sip1 [Arenibacter nanhaiticus]|uniref:Raffinose synthase or seed imbibition protein Sip1 n=1 Tax=Arenibacter nanhaiticus TaxID=558155 RepID=A0A1M6JK14_9FLAO|nr:Sip1-related alpha-galactosidase [Arenibacter nanhaiticus]SHJ47067.1 Raffinose synthase or seed imbibition protein Sip1 [Arenibacter nanhaiticus]